MTASQNKKTLAEELREQVDDRKAQEEAEAKERARRARAAMNQAVRREVPRLVDRCKREAQGAANENRRSVRVVAYDDVAHHAVEKVSEALRKEGFVVNGRAEYLAVRINGDGYAVGGGEPFAVWELNW